MLPKSSKLKSFSAIFLFCSLALPFLGTYVWLQGRIHVAKESASRHLKTAIPQQDEVLLKFSIADSRSNLSWEHSREFEYKGEMYDIIRSETRGDTNWYWCYRDHKETKLKKELNTIIVNMMGPGTQDRNQGLQMRDFFKSLFPPVVNSDAFTTIRYSDRIRLKAYFFSVASYAITPPAPPPDIS